ncbi:MAG: hypothetical protein AAF288_08275 [Planctomycetota bacterium]
MANSTPPSRLGRTRTRRGAPPTRPAAVCLSLSLGVSLGLGAALCAPLAVAQEGADDAPAAAEPVLNPTPELVTTEWSLAFTTGQLDAVVVLDADGEPARYWYLPYKVVNHTGQPRFFTPEIDVMTDSGEIQRGSSSVHSAAVFDAIQNKLRSPLVEPPSRARGWLREGEDFARESVAIWPAPRGDVDELWVYVAGIYGETVQATDPVTGEPLNRVAVDPLTGNPRIGPDGQTLTEPVLLQRTRELHYETPGNPLRPEERPIKFVRQRDVYR